jgi:hypothetical protein
MMNRCPVQPIPDALQGLSIKPLEMGSDLEPATGSERKEAISAVA